MSKPHVGASSSHVTLLTLAASIAAHFTCRCDASYENDDDCGTPWCPCAGDECWNCAARMALANAAETSASATVPVDELGAARQRRDGSPITLDAHADASGVVVDVNLGKPPAPSKP